MLAKYFWPSDAGSGSPSWLTFVAPSKDSLWSVDLFRCESIVLCSFWVLVVMDIFTRRIIGFGVERANIDGIGVCRVERELYVSIRLKRESLAVCLLERKDA